MKAFLQCGLFFFYIATASPTGPSQLGMIQIVGNTADSNGAEGALTDCESRAVSVCSQPEYRNLRKVFIDFLRSDLCEVDPPPETGIHSFTALPTPVACQSNWGCRKSRAPPVRLPSEIKM